MSIAISSPITGQAQTGLTSPTYTVVTDTAPDASTGKQVAVTALGGTQTGVRVHAVSDPFTITMYRPKAPKALTTPNPVTGRYGQVPKNTYGVIVRKGVNFAANQAPEVCIIRMQIDVPAGADAYDSANIRAALSAGLGALVQQSAGLGDMLVNGVI
jgi:hypothetical protein